MPTAYTIETLPRGAVIMNFHGDVVAAADHVEDLLPSGPTVDTQDIAKRLAKSLPRQKIDAIAILRKVTGVGLKEAKELIEANQIPLDKEDWLRQRGYRIGTATDFHYDLSTDPADIDAPWVVWDPRPHGAIFTHQYRDSVIEVAYDRLS